MSYEICVLNNYRGFPSQDNCFQALKCLSEKIAQIVRVEELKELNKEIKAKASLEVPLSAYSTSSYPDCFNQFDFNQSLR